MGAALALAACGSTVQDPRLLTEGPSPSLDPARAKALAERHQEIFLTLNAEAGLPVSGATTPPEWRRFLVAGLSAADDECDAYIRALRYVEIERRRSTRQVNLIGTATAAILGIAQASAQAIAITASAFGLTQATVDNYLGSLVYELPHDSVRSLVDNLRQTYEGTLKERDWTDRSTAFRALRGYVELCTPAVIEANVRAAVQGARVGEQGQRGDLGRARVGVVAATASQGGGGGGPSQPDREVQRPSAPRGLAGAQSEFERSILRGSLAAYREQLCLPATPPAFDQDFRSALVLLRADNAVTGPFTERDRDRLADVPGPCPQALFRNVFERRAWAATGGTGVNATALGAVWRRLRGIDPNLPTALPSPPDMTDAGPLRRALLAVTGSAAYTPETQRDLIARSP